MKEIKTDKEEIDQLIGDFKSYSPEEIIAAGGSTLFAVKTNFSIDKFYLEKEGYLTDEEYLNAIKLLDE